MTTENPNDFFDDLERRLVTATGDRTRRLRRARTRRVATLCTILVALLATGGGLALALSSNTTDNPGVGRPAATAPPATNTTTDPARVALPVPGTFEVAVLNGTGSPGLARSVANRLQGRHFKIGTVTNAPVQDATTTLVYYATPDCLPAAVATVDALGTLVHHQPRPAPRALRVVAGNGAKVIVIAGSQVTLTP